MATVSPNKIKHTPGPEPDTITVGGFKMGTSFEGAYSPTITTDFWQGITPVTNGYTIYTNKASQGPSIHTAADDNELIFYANYFGGSALTTEEALEYFATNPIKCVNIDYPNIVTDGLMSLHDIGYVPSCPRKNITVYDLGQDAANATVDPYDDNNRPYTLTGSSGSGSFISFGSSFTDNYMDFTNTVTPASDVTVCMLFRHNEVTPFGTRGFPLQIANTDYDLRIYLDKYLQFRQYPGPSNVLVTPGYFTYGEWVFVAVSFTPNGSMKIYTDGFLRVEQSFTAILDSPSFYYARVGGWFSTPIESDDGLDVMAVMTYPRVLTQDEVAQNFSAYVSRYQVNVNGTSVTLPEINYTTDGIRMNLDASNPRSYLDQTVWADLAYPDIDFSSLFVMNNSPVFNWVSDNSGIYRSNTSLSTSTSVIPSYSLASFTVEVWVDIRSLVGTNPSIFCEIEGSSQSTFAIYRDPADDIIKAYSYFSGTKQVLDSGVIGSLWQQIVYTYDASTTTTSIYINSSLKNQQVVTGTLASSNLGYKIGGSYNSSAAPGTEGTNMKLSVIRIYEKALSQQEITRNYNAVLPRF